MSTPTEIFVQEFSAFLVSNFADNQYLKMNQMEIVNLSQKLNSLEKMFLEMSKTDSDEECFRRIFDQMSFLITNKMVEFGMQEICPALLYV